MKFFNRIGYLVLSSFVRFMISFTPILFLLRRSLRTNSLSKLDLILEGINKGSIAHRGGVPENTVTAFRRSKQGGATAVEVDLQFTKDGHPVLFHDSTVDRVSDGSGYLQDMTLEEIQKLDVGCKYGHAGAIIPTLDEAVEAVKELEMYMFLEVKDSASGIQTASTVVQLFRSDPLLYERVIVISFFPHLLYKIRQLDPDIIVGLTIRKTVLTRDPDMVFRFDSKWKHLVVSTIEKLMGEILTSYVWKFLGVNLILPHSVDILEKRFDVEYFRKQGVRVVTWTVNSTEDKEYFGKVLRLPFMTDRIND